MKNKAPVIPLEALGLNEDVIAERVAEHIAEAMMAETRLGERIKNSVDARVKNTIDDLAEKHVFPRVAEYIEGLCLQKTNEWGEKTGKPVTFIEYLCERAEAYLNEKVDFRGDAKKASDYSWTGTQTRIAHLVHSHLHNTIETAMKTAVANVHALIVPALAETAKLKLQEIATQLTVTSTVKR